MDEEGEAHWDSSIRVDDAEPCNRPERPSASFRSLLGSRRASRAGARSLQSFGVTEAIRVAQGFAHLKLESCGAAAGAMRFGVS